MLRRLGIVIALAICGAMALSASARDNGQWANEDPLISYWYKTLMQPDNPTVSCCGTADAYWADKVEVKDGKVYATITDDRPDEPLGRAHIPVGTKIEVPPNKLTWKGGNPTGHSLIFLTKWMIVLCYVQSTGI